MTREMMNKWHQAMRLLSMKPSAQAEMRRLLRIRHIFYDEVSRRAKKPYSNSPVFVRNLLESEGFPKAVSDFFTVRWQLSLAMIGFLPVFFQAAFNKAVEVWRKIMIGEKAQKQKSPKRKSAGPGDFIGIKGTA